MISFALMLTVILGLHSLRTGYLIPIFWRHANEFCHWERNICRAMYSAFSKPAWALALSWIIVSCYYGYGGYFIFLKHFSSWSLQGQSTRSCLGTFGYLLEDCPTAGIFCIIPWVIAIDISNVILPHLRRFTWFFCRITTSCTGPHLLILWVKCAVK